MNFDSLESYILSHIDAEPDLLKEVARETRAKILHAGMMSGHLQGRILKMLTQMVRPRKVLEIGTFVGYSTLCFAEALDEGCQIDTIEINDELEDFILNNFSRSEHKEKIKLHIGDAAELVRGFEDETFELVFIDADKRLYQEYLEQVLPKVKPGGFIIADNTLWYGKVIEKVDSNDWATQAILEFNEKLAGDKRVEKVILPIRDGLTLIRKK